MKKTVKKSVPYRNLSPYGWWIASYLVRFEEIEEDRSNEKRRCLAWENTIIIRAPNRDKAYVKALSTAKNVYPRAWRRYGTPPGKKGRWILEGLTELLPIYEKLVDGAELMYSEHRDSVINVKKMVKKKTALSVFCDEK